MVSGCKMSSSTTTDLRTIKNKNKTQRWQHSVQFMTFQWTGDDQDALKNYLSFYIQIFKWLLMKYCVFNYFCLVLVSRKLYLANICGFVSTEIH